MSLLKTGWVKLTEELENEESEDESENWIIEVFEEFGNEESEDAIIKNR